MISSRGYGLEEVKKSQVGTVVLECRIRFKRELRLREEVVIATQLYEISKKTAIIRHEILKKDGSVAAEAFFTMGCFDLSLRRLMSPTSAWLAAVTGKMP